MQAGHVNKDTQDLYRVVVDFSNWLDSGEIVGSATLATVAVLQEASWSADPYVVTPPLPVVDTTPLVVSSEAIVSGAGGSNTAVRLMLGVGTPGVTYVVSFVVTGQTSGRQKNIDLTVTVRQPLAPAPPAIVGHPPSTVHTTSFTIVAGTQLWLCDPTSGAITATLPVSPAAGDFYTVKDATGQAGIHAITVVGGLNNIEGAATLLINTAYGFVNLIFTGTQWVQVSAPLVGGTVQSVQTVSFTASGSQTIYLCDPSTGAITATLPAAPAVGAAYTIKDSTGQAASHGITIAGNGYSIDGSASLLIDTPYGFATIEFTGTQWVQVG